MKQQILPYKSSDSTEFSVDLKPIDLFEATSIKKEIVPYAFSENDYNQELSTTINLFENADSFSSPNTIQYTEQKSEDEVIVIHYNKINDTTNNWMFWVLLGGLVVFGWVRLIYRKQLSLMLSSAINYNFALKTIRNNHEFTDRFSLLLTIVFVFNAGLFAFQAFSFFNIQTFPGLQSVAITSIIAAGIFVLYALKELIFRILGFIFQEDDYTQEYTHNIYLYNKTLGLFLFPITISLAFVQETVISHKTLIFAGIGLFILFFFLRIIRGIQISIRSNISILYMFLYFCTLEVLPILILVKTGALLSSKLYL